MKNEFGNFIKVYDFMIIDLKLAKIDLLVYAYMFSLNQNNRSYYGSQQALADKFGVSKRTMNDVLGNLVNRGLLLKDRISIPQGQGCVYDINYDMIEQYR